MNMSSVVRTPPSHRSQGFEKAVQAQREFLVAFVALGFVERIQFLASHQIATVIISIIGLLSGLYLSSEFFASGDMIFSGAGIISLAQGANPTVPKLPVEPTDHVLLFVGEHLSILLVFAAFIACLIVFGSTRNNTVVGAVERIAIGLAGALCLDALIHMLQAIIRGTGGS
jgi:hypothetical protein